MANTQPNVGSNNGRPEIRDGPGHRGFTLTESTVSDPRTATLCTPTSGLSRGAQGPTESARDRALGRRNDRVYPEILALDPSAKRLTIDFSRFSPLPKSGPSSPDLSWLEKPRDFEFDPNSLFLDAPIDAPKTCDNPQVAAVTVPTIPRPSLPPIAPRNPPGLNNPRPSRFTEDL